MGLGSVAQVGAPEAPARWRRSTARPSPLGGHPLHDRREERRQRRADHRASGATFKQVAEQVLADFETSQRHPARRAAPGGRCSRYTPIRYSADIRGRRHRARRRASRPCAQSGARCSTPAAGCRRRIEHVIDEAITLKLSAQPNPARYADLKRSLAAFVAEKPRGHHKALPWRQVPALMKRLLANNSLSAAALRLTILSACRTGEVLGAAWPEFAHGVWTMPAARMKGEVGRRKPHRVPVTAASRACWPSSSRAANFRHCCSPTRRPASRSAIWRCWCCSRAWASTRRARFSISFRDFCAEQNFPRELAEAALAHRVAGVEGAYLRAGLFDARRAMMQAWSRLLPRRHQREADGAQEAVTGG